MSKIIVPRANDREKAVFDKFNITLIDSISEREFEHVIIEFLNTHNVLHLATCRNSEPRSTPLEYFNNGLTVHIVSEGGGKFANLKVNPKTSYSIAEPYDPEKDFFSATGLQVWGIASMFRKNDDLKKYEDIRRYSRDADGLKKQGIDQLASAVNMNVITVEPLKLRYLDLKKGFRNVMWERD